MQLASHREGSSSQEREFGQFNANVDLENIEDDEDILIDDDEQSPFTVSTVLNTRGGPPTYTRPQVQNTNSIKHCGDSITSIAYSNNQ
jgi:hypothetical protein